MKTLALFLLLSVSALAQRDETIMIRHHPSGGGGGNTVTAVQHKIVQTGASASSTCAMTVTSGNAIACFGQAFDSASYFTFTISDSANTYTQQGSTVNNADRHISSAMWLAPVTSAGAKSIVVTASGTPNGGITCACYEAHGSSSTPVVDAHNVAGSSGSALTATPCGAMTATGTSELALAGVQASSAAYTWTAGGSYTKDACYTATGSCTGSDDGAVESLAGVSTNQTPTFTASLGAFWTTECMLLK